MISARDLQFLHMSASVHLCRYILVDWLVEVTTMKDFSSLTLHVTVGCVDRYLALRSVPKARLQLLGIACMVVCTRWEHPLSCPSCNYCCGDDYPHVYLDFYEKQFHWRFKYFVVLFWHHFVVVLTATWVKKSWPYVRLFGSLTTPTNMRTWFEWWERSSLCWGERSEWVQQI